MYNIDSEVLEKLYSQCRKSSLNKETKKLQEKIENDFSLLESFGLTVVYDELKNDLFEKIQKAKKELEQQSLEEFEKTLISIIEHRKSVFDKEFSKKNAENFMFVYEKYQESNFYMINNEVTYKFIPEKLLMQIHIKKDNYIINIDKNNSAYLSSIEGYGEKRDKYKIQLFNDNRLYILDSLKKTGYEEKTEIFKMLKSVEKIARDANNHSGIKFSDYISNFYNKNFSNFNHFEKIFNEQNELHKLATDFSINVDKEKIYKPRRYKIY